MWHAVGPDSGELDLDEVVDLIEDSSSKTADGLEWVMEQVDSFDVNKNGYISRCGSSGAATASVLFLLHAHTHTHTLTLRQERVPRRAAG